MNLKKKIKPILFIIIGTAVLFSACNRKEKKEKKLLEAYIADNDISESPTDSGMYYIETKAGTGNNPKTGDRVTVHYKGMFIDGEVFDSSIGKDPFTFTLGIGQVIRGWDEGIAYMKKGGKATLIIPSNLAYGVNGRGTIPGYSTLVFEVELLEITPNK